MLGVYRISQVLSWGLQTWVVGSRSLSYNVPSTRFKLILPYHGETKHVTTQRNIVSLPSPVALPVNLRRYLEWHFPCGNHSLFLSDGTWDIFVCLCFLHLPPPSGFFWWTSWREVGGHTASVVRKQKEETVTPQLLPLKPSPPWWTASWNCESK